MSMQADLNMEIGVQIMQKNNLWDNLSEEEILLRAKQQENDAIDYLMQKYKALVRKKARSLFMIGGDQDDLMQEGMIGLFKAVRDYDPKQDTVFSTFADLCIGRQMYSAIKSSNRQKNLPLNTYISLYAPAYSLESSEEDGHFMVDLERLNGGQNPEKIIIDKETAEHAREELLHSLSKMETQVLECYLDGMTYQEIAHTMGKEPKKIDNALQRIRNKVNRLQKKSIP